LGTGRSAAANPLRFVPGSNGAEMAICWQASTLVQCVSVRPWLEYPGCDGSGGCHDLTLGKIYERMGVEAKGAFYRIVDDSNEDYLYPASHFRAV
jgi:hypothetical protein